MGIGYTTILHDLAFFFISWLSKLYDTFYFDSSWCRPKLHFMYSYILLWYKCQVPGRKYVQIILIAILIYLP